MYEWNERRILEESGDMNDNVVQGSGTYGSRARCGSFDDCIRLADKIGV